jgi:hypothetical protein
MKVQTILFNIILLLGLAAGCRTADDRKEFSTIRFHMEANPEGGWTTVTAHIYRENSVPVPVEKSPFLDERDVARAAVMEELGGFYLQIEFNRHGTLLLETMTRTNPGRRIAVHSEFPESRWLAAPQINRPISNGVLTFTPDASREEAERIVRGLNNVAAKAKKEERF